jgi:hypothetical protein
MTEPAAMPRELSWLGRTCLVLGASLVVLFATVFVAGFCGLLVRVRPGPWLIAPAVLVQIGFTVLAWRRTDPPRPWVGVAAIVVAGWLLILVAGLSSQLTTDTSVDGRHYQSETTRAVARGWNPVRDGPLFPRDRPYQPDATPKASAIIGATVLRTTDSIDATRLVGAVLLVAAALLAIAAVEAAGGGRAVAIFGGAVLAANPVALAQLGTAMVDGVVSSLLLAAIALTLLWVWRHPPVIVLPALGGALALLVNTKFTGLVYVGIVIIPVLVLAGLIVRLGLRLLWMVVAVGVIALVATLGLGYNPYVTNLLRHEHPLHPVYGPDSLDIGAQYRTGELETASEPERLWLSVAGESTTDDDAHLKVPFVFSTDEWSAFRSPSVRIGGFGPWFSGGLVLALVALVAALIVGLTSRGRGTRCAWTLIGVAGICLVSTLVQPSAFLARFAPQLWFVAPLLGIAIALSAVMRVVQALAWATLAVLAVDAAGVAAATAVWDKRDTDREAASLATLRRLSPLEARFQSWRRSEARRLREAGIRFTAEPQVHCAVPYILSVAGGLTRQPQLFGVPPPRGGVQLCPLPTPPPPPG